MLPKVVMSVLTYRLTATIWKEPEGYVARCSELGVASAGDSPSDVLANLKEVTELYLENVMLSNGLIPIKFGSSVLLLTV
jgi:predicted RNase H-like HicB family nuclease